MIDSENEYVQSATAVLEELGFKVYLNAAVEGLSGLVHVFDIVARKPDRIVYVSVKPSTPLNILAEVAKSLDVKGEVFIAAVGEVDRGMRVDYNGKRLKIVDVKSPRDLADKLREALA
ncbi:MAG: hypothetical protein NZ954_07005 [Thermofilaceae archaeon]|nr:hypothetical protein [Thermofilaceae archaeon]MCX8181354.1 hypothetical protein [Thermofilaceae archaeon]MDW8003596.1 hypothetical protein [Thermofilaceae archaeon]